MNLEMALEYFKQLKENGESQKLGGQFNTALPLAIWALEEAVNKTSYEGNIECIDAMVESQGVEAVKDFCVCNAFKYIWRHRKKNNLEDIKKAKWYIDKYIELEEKLNER